MPRILRLRRETFRRLRAFREQLPAPSSLSFILRETGAKVLREDGTKVARE